MKRVFLLPMLLLGAASVQAGLPPVWQNQSDRIVTHDTRVRDYVIPQRIVWSHDPGGLIRNAEFLMTRGSGQAELAPPTPRCILRSTDTESPSLLLDFGRELQGGIRIITGASPTNRPVRVRVRLGESVSEAMCEIDGENGASNDHAMRDFTMELPWLGTAEAGASGFRFVRIDLLDPDTELHIQEISASFTYRDLPYLGSFRSSDPRLDSIWMTGAYTVHLNMQGYLWDGIKRDRLVWVGDMHPEVMTILSVFDCPEVVEKSLDLVRDITPPDQWMNGISSYSLWWLIILHDWYFYTDDEEYIAQNGDYIAALTDHILTRIGPDGRERLDGTRFLDWPSSDNPEAIHAGLQALVGRTLDAVAALADGPLQNHDLQDRCLEALGRVKSYGAPDPNGSKQAAALLLLSGLGDRAALRELLSEGGSRGFSTFYGYYMLEGMMSTGYSTEALDRIREYWGAMLDLGATTFWEDFNMDWIPGSARIDEPVPAGMKDIHGDFGAYCYERFRHSLCHGWASGPTAFLSRYVLGVYPAEPGYRSIEVHPWLGDLEWAEGNVPTPYGAIRVRHERRSDGTIFTEIELPLGIVWDGPEADSPHTFSLTRYLPDSGSEATSR